MSSVSVNFFSFHHKLYTLKPVKHVCQLCGLCRTGLTVIRVFRNISNYRLAKRGKVMVSQISVNQSLKDGRSSEPGIFPLTLSPFRHRNVTWSQQCSPPPTPHNRLCASGLYASYWNAFLSNIYMLQVNEAIKTKLTFSESDFCNKISTLFHELSIFYNTLLPLFQRLSGIGNGCSDAYKEDHDNLSALSCNHDTCYSQIGLKPSSKSRQCKYPDTVYPVKKI